MRLQSVLQANCCWEASLLLWIKHYCQCIKKKPCCILPSPPSLFLIITKELILDQCFAKKAFSTHEGDSSCALWWDHEGVADSNESLQKKVLTKPQGRITRLKSASKTWLSSWWRIIYLNLQLNGTHTRRFKAHEYEYIEPKMRRTLWADPWGADYAEGEIFLIQINCHVLCGGKKSTFTNAHLHPPQSS